MKLKKIYKILRQVQQNIQSDGSDLLISSPFKTLIFDDRILNKELFDISEQNKKYYENIFYLYFLFNQNEDFEKDLISKSRLNHYTIPETFWIKIDQNKESNLLKTIIKLENKGVLSPILIDYLSYSLIPQFYNGFLDKKSLNSFCSLIEGLISSFKRNKIQKELHFFFARPLFHSPVLAEFLFEAVYPIFKPLYENNANIGDQNEVEKIQNAVFSSIKENIWSFPFNIKIFIEKFDQKFNFLRECLVKPMSEHPDLFLMNDYWNLSDQDNTNFLKELIQKVFNNSFIEKIESIIRSTEYFDVSMIDQSEKAPMTKIKHFIFVNSYDMNCMKLIDDFISNNEGNQQCGPIDISSNIRDKYILYYTGDCSYFYDDDEEEIRPPTMNDVKDCWIHLKRILENAAPLELNPGFSDEIATEDSFLDMIEKYLVNGSEESEIESQRLSFEYFKECIHSNAKIRQCIESEEQFTMKMRFLSRYQKDKTVTSQLIKQFALDSIEINFKQSHPSDIIKVLILLLKNNILQHFPPTKEKKVIDYSSNQPIFSNEVIMLLKQKIGSFYDTNNEPLILSLFLHNQYKNVTYNDFKSCRTDLVECDKKYNEIISHSTHDMQKETTQIDPSLKYLGYFVGSLYRELFYCYIKEIRKVNARNDDFFTKINDLQRIESFLHENALVFFDIDNADNFVLFYQNIIMVANPKDLISSKAFLNKCFVNYDNVLMIGLPEISEGIIRTVCANYEFNRTLSLRAMNDKHAELFIVGNNSLYTVSIYNLLCHLCRCDRMKLPDQEISQIVNLLDSNPNSIIPLQLTIEGFGKSQKGYKRFDVKIGYYIKKNTKQNYDLRYAIFACSDASSISNYFRDFRKNKYICDKNKVVVVPKNSKNKNLDCEGIQKATHDTLQRKLYLMIFD